MYEDFTARLKDRFMELLSCYMPKAHAPRGTKVKGDSTPVTSLDHFGLEEIRLLIEEIFPDDLTIGEEDKREDKQIQQILARRDEYQWAIDGLDGTWHYIRGTNSYGAMVACRRGDAVLYAAIFRPIDMVLRGNGFFFAEQGRGTWEWCLDCYTYHRLHTAPNGENGPLERRVILLEGSSKEFYKSGVKHLGATVTTRASLSSCIAATTVARGDASAVVTVGHKPWDAWPIGLMVEEAGGVVTDHEGNPWSPERSGNLIAAANKEEHTAILNILRNGSAEKREEERDE